MKTIREYRQARGWTQEQLAHELGVTSSAVYSWEAGKRVPHVFQLRKLAWAFGVKMDDIALIEPEGKAAA